MGGEVFLELTGEFFGIAEGGFEAVNSGDIGSVLAANEACVEGGGVEAVTEIMQEF